MMKQQERHFSNGRQEGLREKIEQCEREREVCKIARMTSIGYLYTSMVRLTTLSYIHTQKHTHTHNYLAESLADVE